MQVAAKTTKGVNILILWLLLYLWFQTPPQVYRGYILVS